MRFDIPAVVSQVADRIMGKVDATPGAFVNMEFSDIVNGEMEWLLDYKPVQRIYDSLLEQILNHPEMLLCESTFYEAMRDYSAEIKQAEREERWALAQYRREVL